MYLFLLTDIEGSTRLWEANPAGMRTALLEHDRILTNCVAKGGGEVVKHTGDGIFAVFPSDSNALDTALQIQQRMQPTDWGNLGELRVRVAVHAGDAQKRDTDYFGTEVNRTARLLDAGWGGQILLSEKASGVCSLPKGATLRDHGPNMLRDLERPLRILSLDHPDLLIRDFPELRTLSNRPNNLPEQSTPFMGRGREIREIAELLSSATTRLLTITGIGGVGKTRLALQVASELCDRYEDGVFFVPLSGLNSVEQTFPAIAEVLSIPLSGRDDPEDQLLSCLADRNLLLVLDNFEHLLSATSVVSEILGSTRALQVIVTSRSRLGLSSEQLYHLQGLDRPVSSVTASLESSSSLDLFREAARRQLGRFDPDHVDREVIAAICDMLDGLPLGIELAAAWITVLEPIEILSELKKSKDILTTDWADMPERHRSIRAVFDYSWNLLPEDSRMALSAISVFRGGFTRTAAREAAGVTLQQLRSLSDRSLLSRRSKGRYRVHELIAEFAEEKLLEYPRLATDVRRGFAEHYCRFLSARRYALTGSASSTAYSEIGEEIDNVRRAWSWGLEVLEDDDLLIDAAAALQTWLTGKGQFEEATKGFRDGAEKVGPSRHQLHWMLRVLEAGAYVRKTDYSTAREILESCLDAFEIRDDGNGTLNTIYRLGSVYMREGHTDRAREHMTRGLRLAEESGERRLEGMMYTGLGDIENHAYRPGKAAGHCRKAIDIQSEVGDLFGEFCSTVTLSDALTKGVDVDGAIAAAERAIRVSEGLGSPSSQALALGCMASALVASGAFSEAAGYARESFEIYDGIGSIWGRQLLLPELARISMESGEADQAREALENAMRVTEQAGVSYNSVECLADCAEIWLGLEEAERALEYLRKAIRLTAGTGGAVRALPLQERLAELCLEQGRPEEAASSLCTALRNARSMNDTDRLHKALQCAARTALTLGQRHRAASIVGYLSSACRDVPEDLITEAAKTEEGGAARSGADLGGLLESIDADWCRETVNPGSGAD